MNGNASNAVALLIGRILLAAIFVQAGLMKISNYAGVQGYMEKAHVPGVLLPLVILLELGGGLAIVVGFKTRWIALAMGLFCVASAVMFHMDFSNQVQATNFMKNLSMAGGFLALFAAGAGRYSWDGRSSR
jgi:putative oxidoreductase